MVAATAPALATRMAAHLRGETLRAYESADLAGVEIELADSNATVRIDAAELLRDLRTRMDQARQLMDCLS